MQKNNTPTQSAAARLVDSENLSKKIKTIFKETTRTHKKCCLISRS